METHKPTLAIDERPAGSMIISRAPLRISFFGGGTDYPEYFQPHGGGAVLATAIDKFSYITASRFPSHLFDYSIRISYRKSELVRSVDEIKHRVFREVLRRGGIERDIELHNVADLPAFTGLGSSSTFTVALLQAVHAFRNENLAGLPLAYQAIEMERKVLGEAVGCQDQTIAAIGGFNLIEFKAEDDIRAHHVPVSPARLAELEAHLMLFFTGISRKAGEVASAQLRRMPLNLPVLAQMRAMAYRGLELISGAYDIAEFGRLLHQAWEAKRSLADNISHPEIDGMYRSALEGGAYGGKLLGAGGGGFLMICAPPEKQARLRASFSKYYEIRVRLNARGAEIIL